MSFIILPLVYIDLSIVQGWYTRPIGSSSIKGLSLTLPQNKKKNVKLQHVIWILVPVWIQFGFKQHFTARHVRRVLLILGRFVVCFLLGNFPASEFYMPTFWNTLSVPSS
jgi:hypothetical protein